MVNRCSFPQAKRLTICCQVRNPNFYSRKPTTHAWLTPQNAAFFVQTSNFWPILINSGDPNSTPGRTTTDAWLTLLNPAFLVRTSNGWPVFVNSGNHISIPGTHDSRMTHAQFTPLNPVFPRKASISWFYGFFQDVKILLQEGQRLTHDSRF